MPTPDGSTQKALADSGDRSDVAGTGALRDMAEGKGRCDLLPACALLRLAKHYEAGAKKYSDRNWEKGLPISNFMDSGLRHLLKYLDGMDDEDHLAAAAWNILGAMWTEEKKPELMDIPARNIADVLLPGVHYKRTTLDWNLPDGEEPKDFGVAALGPQGCCLPVRINPAPILNYIGPIESYGKLLSLDRSQYKMGDVYSIGEVRYVFTPMNDDFAWLPVRDKEESYDES